MGTRSTSTASAELLITAVVGVVSAFLVYAAQSSPATSTTDDEVERETVEGRIDNCPSSSQTFPWEVKKAKDEEAEKELLEADKPVHNPRLRTSNDQQELNFLASMTFANGGLRAPSCPCRAQPGTVSKMEGLHDGVLMVVDCFQVDC
eukprot:scaffold8505_cov130-Cylindrotheca_fusiformis.AAC.19